jgi:hypothetical protein
MSDQVKLGLNGHLLAAEEETGERLRGMTGAYRWLPTAPDALLLVRDPPQGGTSSPPRVALMGDLGVTALAEIVEFLHQARKTGILRIVQASGERGVVMQEGMVRGAFSSDPEHKLPEICLQMGLVPRPVLDSVLAQDPPTLRIGRALVDAGALSSHDLFKAVQHQVGEIVAAMLAAREGLFFFTDEPVEERAIAGVQLHTQGLLMDAIRRIDEMAQFRLRLPSGKLFVARRKPADPALEDDERRALALCNGLRTLLDLARELRTGEFDATKLVYHLLQGGYVQVSATPQPVLEPAQRSDPAEVARVFDHIFREIVRAVAARGDAAGFVHAANGALATEANSRSHFLRGLAFGPNGALDPSAIVRSLGDGDGAAHARAVFTALSEVMFFLLFQASETLSGQEDEALARQVKEMLAAVEPR